MNNKPAEPDSTAVRVALWRALHPKLDNLPFILEDNVGLELADPDEGWEQRQDMDPEFTKRLRLSIVMRSRYIEDLVMEQFSHGVRQYVILGAGLDTFVQRRSEFASKLKIFEIDRFEPQEWKKQRLIELGFGIPDNLIFVPDDFDKESWWDKLLSYGFEPSQTSVIVSTGVSPYISKSATKDTLQNFANVAPGSKLAMSFLLPIDLIEEEDQMLMEISAKGAKASGTPFVSFYKPSEIIDLAKDVGFQKVEHVSVRDMRKRYFTGREDHLLPASGEEFLVATT